MRKSLSLVIAAFAALLVPSTVGAAPKPTPGADSHLILITLDGTRWQDVFRGPDPVLLEDTHFTDEDLKGLTKSAWFDVPDRGAALMPFLHDVMGKQGVLFGDRDHGQCAQVANDMWFSYPGYNEILTGKPDDTIVTNGKNYNKNTTFLEWLNRRPDFAGRVEVYGTWDVFPYIINDKRSGVPVNKGLGSRFPTDTLTARYALESLRTAKPRVLYVAFGDTDELAHVGDYDGYLASANRVDDFIRQVWDMVESDPAYRGKTTLIVTTDHGRGNRPDRSWTEHSSKTHLQMFPKYLREFNETGIEGSGEIWFAALGRGVDHASVVPQGECLTQSRIAASALTALGLDWKAFDPSAGKPLPQFGHPSR